MFVKKRRNGCAVELNCGPTSAEDITYMEQLPYRQILGALNYLTCTIRIDISFPVNYLSRFMDNPGRPHWDQLLNTLAYVRDHPIASITYSDPSYRSYTFKGQTHHMKPNHLYCFVDADFASSDIDERHSTTGYIIIFNGGIISWKSQKQKRVAGSSTEAEYIALYEACKECIWLLRILHELGFEHNEPIIVFEDNTSTIRASENSVEHSKLKHLEINYHAIREYIEEKLICAVHISTQNQLADLLTKNHSPLRHQTLCHSIITIVPINKAVR